MLRTIEPGMILRSKITHKTCAVSYKDKGRVDLIFTAKFQIRDVPLQNVAREYYLVKDCVRPSIAIEEVLDGQTTTD